MCCSQCGSHLADEALFCSQCGRKNAPVTTDAHNSSVHDTPQDSVLIEGLCNRVKNAMYVENGRAALTNTRFIYYKHNVAKTLAIGFLVNLTKGEIDIELPISEIDHIEDGRQGVSKTILLFTKAGEKYNFYFTKREEWKAAFEHVMRKNI